MRPVEKGAAPGTYTNYKDAKQDLVNVLGSYCSYCERRIATNLAVEHIQPKNLPQYAHLICDWCNFLLACTNCNSAKGAGDFDLAAHALPDRDNEEWFIEDLAGKNTARGTSFRREHPR